jgi:hypothetical protein
MANNADAPAGGDQNISANNTENLETNASENNTTTASSTPGRTGGENNSAININSLFL